MVNINGVQYYTPSEIAERGLISSPRGTSSYHYVVRMIKENRLKAGIANDKNVPRYLVSETEIERFSANQLSGLLEGDS